MAQIGNQTGVPKDKELSAAVKKITKKTLHRKKEVLEADASARNGAIECATDYCEQAKYTGSKAVDDANNAFRNSEGVNARDLAERALEEAQNAVRFANEAASILNAVNDAAQKKRSTYVVEDFATQSAKSSINAVKSAAKAGEFIKMITENASRYLYTEIFRYIFCK